MTSAVPVSRFERKLIDVSLGRPKGHGDEYLRVDVPRQRTHLTVGDSRDPDVDVAVVIRQKRHFTFIGTECQSLDFAGLACDSDAMFCVVRRLAGDRKLPDVRLRPHPAHHQVALRIHVWISIGRLTEGHLRTSSAIQWDAPQVVRRRIGHRASLRRADDQSRAVWTQVNPCRATSSMSRREEAASDVDDSQIGSE